MIKVIWALSAACIGGLIGIKLKIPAGGLIGSMVAVGFLQICKFELNLPVQFRMTGEILVGGAIGLGFTREIFLSLRKLIFPSLLIMVSVVIFGIIVGLLIYKTTCLDLVTSIYASSPGGITNMTIMSDSLGGDSKVVATMQLIRLISLIFFLPPIIKYILKLGI